MKTHTLRTLSTITVLLLCLGLQACQDKGQEPAEEKTGPADEIHIGNLDLLASLSFE